MEPFRALGLFLCLPKMPASGVVPNRERCHVGASDTKLLLLFRKKSRLLRLLGCKRPRNASAALPTFCEYTPCHRHPNWAGLPAFLEKPPKQAVFLRFGENFRRLTHRLNSVTEGGGKDEDGVSGKRSTTANP